MQDPNEVLQVARSFMTAGKAESVLRLLRKVEVGSQILLMIYLFRTIIAFIPESEHRNAQPIEEVPFE